MSTPEETNGEQPIGLHNLKPAPGSRKARKRVGRGELSKKFTVHAHKFSKTARERIEAAGGTCQLIEP